MAEPLCKKHNCERVATQTGKKKLWVLACPKCQAEKAGPAPSAPATPPAKAPAAAAPPADDKKKSSGGWFFTRKQT